MYNQSQCWTLVLKRLIVLLAVFFIALPALLLLPTQPANASVVSPSRISLFLPNEWKTMTNTSPLEIAVQISKRLELRRDEIGRAALHTVHRFASYQETEPVFFAVHDGNIYVLRLIVHWQRNLGVVERKHTTIIDWEIINNQHYRAIVQSDDSTFPAHSIEELDELFSKLIFTKT